MLNRRPSVYISIRGADHSTAGGSNTFAWNMSRYLIKKNIPLASSILNASHAIVIADKVNLTVLKIAKTTGCFILHRLDEDFVSPDALTLKHQKIIKINAYADTTIFQSNFVKDNLLQYLPHTVSPVSNHIIFAECRPWDGICNCWSFIWCSNCKWWARQGLQRSYHFHFWKLNSLWADDNTSWLI